MTFYCEQCGCDPRDCRCEEECQEEEMSFIPYEAAHYKHHVSDVLDPSAVTKGRKKEMITRRKRRLILYGNQTNWEGRCTENTALPDVIYRCGLYKGHTGVCLMERYKDRDGIVTD